MATVDLDRLGQLVQAAADIEILPRYRNLDSDDTVAKTVAEDLVTIADKGMETRLSAALSQEWPDAAVIGEEGVFEDQGLLGAIAEDRTCFVIDPIDGTWNFAHGLPMFGVIVAVTRGGQTTHGLIADPLGRDFICAERGGGAWHVRADGQKVRLRAADALDPLSDMSGYVGLGLFDLPARARLAPELNDFARVMTLRASAFEYRVLAQGGMHFSLSGNLNAWDHAAGQLIHAEAGGYNAMIDGTSYSPTMTAGHLLLAPDRASWHQLAARFGPAL